MNESAASGLAKLKSPLKYEFNIEELSDVLFLVGEEKVKIYAHKMVLALASPVFKTMFYSENTYSETNDKTVEIMDCTPTGFLNMVKFFYGEIKFKKIPLSELEETCVACNKYLVYDLAERLLDYSEKNMDLSNCIFFYDLLVRFKGETSLSHVRSFIQENTRAALNDDYFIEIREDTLIDLLKLETLTVDELKLIKLCLKWVDSQVVRLGLEPNRENKNKVFEPLKSYIKFTELSHEKLEIIKFKIKDLLTDSEIGSLLMHLWYKNENFMIKCKTTRVNVNDRIVSLAPVENPSKNYTQFGRWLNYGFSADKKVDVLSIWTTLKSPHTEKVKLSIFKFNKALDLHYSVHLKDGKLYFKFDELILNQNVCYRLKIDFSEDVINDEKGDSNAFSLWKNYTGGGRVEFKFVGQYETIYNCFEEIDCDLLE